ncbi:hypothetical protein BC828DRAFT_381528 [Blastocladiella britannica]|nr:hypothetical protein BC828DRAFT_381528 [Blastocladiella britannica]
MHLSLLSILALIALLSTHTQAAFPDKSAWCLRGGCTDPPAALVADTLAQEAKIYGTAAATCGDGICNVVAGEHCLTCPSDCGVCGLTAPVVRCVNPKHAALTFDDGPGPATAGMLKALDALKVKGTFFVVGEVVMQNPDLYSVMKGAADNGHEIGLHTYTHRSLGSTGRMDPPVTNSKEMTPIEVRAEAVFTDLAVQYAIGLRPRFLRLPFLEYTDKSIAVLDTLGYVPLSINVDTNDWQVAELAGGTTAMIMTNFNTELPAALGSGIIVLQHDVYALSSTAIPQIVKTLQDAGYTLVTVSTCLGVPAYRNATDPPLFASRFDGPTGKLASLVDHVNATLTNTTTNNPIGAGDVTQIKTPPTNVTTNTDNTGSNGGYTNNDNKETGGTVKGASLASSSAASSNQWSAAGAAAAAIAPIAAFAAAIK